MVSVITMDNIATTILIIFLAD